MQASIVDLRYKMEDMLRALERRETVTILYHGKVKGTTVPVERDAGPRVTAHPFFGMKADDARPVERAVAELRVAFRASQGSAGHVDYAIAVTAIDANISWPTS